MGDEAFESLRAAINGASIADVTDLIAEARNEARSRVRAILVDVMSEVMLEGVRRELDLTPTEPSFERPQERSSRPAPTPGREAHAARAEHWSADDRGWYLYGVAAADGASPIAELAGVDPAHEVTLLSAHGLTAIVSRVPLADFSQERLRERLTDLSWLGRIARSHEKVLETVRERQALIPMRLFAIYRDENGVREMLGRDADAFKDALERLKGKSEWGVKVFAHAAPENPAQRWRQTIDAGTADAGSAYMENRFAAHDRRRHDDRVAQIACEHIHGRLCAIAVDGLISAPQRPEVSGHPGEMILNGVYLVKDGRQGHFEHELDALEAEFSTMGLQVEKTGPGPAYNFISGTIGATTFASPVSAGFT